MTRRTPEALMTMMLGWLAAAAVAVAEGDDGPKAAPAEQPPYVQTGVVEAAAGHGSILGFCVPPGGGLVAVTGFKEQLVAGPRRHGAAPLRVHRVAWFDTENAETRSVQLDFAATAIAAAPDGGFYVAGDGTVALVSAEGKENARGATPQVVQTEEEREELGKTVAEKRDAQLASYEKQIERLRTAVAELEERAEDAEQAVAGAAEAEANADMDETERAAAEERARNARKTRETRLRMARTQASRTAQQLRDLEARAESVRRQDPRQLVDQALRKMRQVRAISASRDAVFLIVGESSGYGYAAWRLDTRFKNPKKILEKLFGCCGQMDVQVVGGRLAVANQRHRVQLCSFDGEAVGTVGTKAAAGDHGAGFSGCCNPMNTCAAPDGSLLTSESNGVVKRFDADGGFVEILGTAGVRPGCKNSAIAIEPDGSRLYYMDSAAGKVLVLTKREGREAADDVAAADRGE